jgi:hypothetical protein
LFWVHPTTHWTNRGGQSPKRLVSRCPTLSPVSPQCRWLPGGHPAQSPAANCFWLKII